MNSATNRDASAHCFWRGRGAPGCWMVLLGLFILGTGKGLAEEGNRLDWWSLKPLVLPQVPVLQKNQRTLRNPIDRFVQARLVEHGLTLSPEADRRTLIRRVYFDLTGLSPSPADVAAFVKDRDSRAYERLVDRLLASPRYGERWARHWLDTVHFAETHGNDQDRPRENAWPYRDYVIHALNDDKPYARFVTEQVAADALYPGEPALIPALGFLASGPWDESSLRDIREDTIDRQIARYLDRDDIVTTVMSTFTSTTVHCARCHDHKFDAISQREYYSLQAVFAGTEKAERYYDLDPKVNARREELMRQQIALDRRDPNVMERMLTPERRAEFAAWEASLSQAPEKWIVLKADSVTAEKGTTFAAQPDGSMLATGPAPETEVYTFTATTDLTGITAARLEVLPDDSLPKHGPGRQPDNGNLHLSEFRLAVAARGQTNAPQNVTLQNATADFNQADWGIERAIDGNPQTAWGIHPEEGKAHTAVFELSREIGQTNGATLVFTLEQRHGGRHTIGRFRLAVTTQPRPVRAAPAAWAKLLSKPREQRTEAEERDLRIHFLGERLARETAALPAPQRVFAGANVFPPDAGHKALGMPREVRVLKRGEITRPVAEAEPAALRFVGGLSAALEIKNASNEAERRAALAQWIVDPRNSLTWRSIVNRVWHYHFGRGLVETPNDFGHMGGTPSHPGLLDWLAVTFRDGGGSLKDLHRLILMSAVYRQSSRSQVRAAKLDSDDRLLWRMNRSRLEAETVRDTALQMAGRLDLTMGGPSVKQFVMSPGIHVTPKVDYAAFDPDGPGSTRRAIYRFLFRTLPDPLMDALDCPAGDQLAPVRTESATALQAFAMLNNAFLVRQCEHWAARLEAATPDVKARVRAVFQLALLREPTATELADCSALARQHGLANVCRVVLNSNEFLFVD